MTKIECLESPWKIESIGRRLRADQIVPNIELHPSLLPRPIPPRGNLGTSTTTARGRKTMTPPRFSTRGSATAPFQMTKRILTDPKRMRIRTAINRVDSSVTAINAAIIIYPQEMELNTTTPETRKTMTGDPIGAGPQTRSNLLIFLTSPPPTLYKMRKTKAPGPWWNQQAGTPLLEPVIQVPIIRLP